jgi:PAS domain S-box-containing protein
LPAVLIVAGLWFKGGVWFLSANRFSIPKEKGSGLNMIWPAIPLSLLLLALALSRSFSSEWTWEPPMLLPALNLLFLTLIPGLIAVLGARSYLQSGRLGLLLLGAGAAALGLTSLLTGWYLKTPGGINITVTIYNSGFLLAGLLHLTGVIVMAERGVFTEQSRRLRWPALAIAYTLVAAVIMILAAAAWQARLPLFFLQGVGPTPLRQAVLGAAVGTFLLSALLILNIYRESRSRFLYWYGWGLALIALGLVAILTITRVGGMVNWIGRIAQFLGGIYLLIAVISARRARMSAAEVVAELSRQPRELHAAIFQNSLDGILVMISDGRIIDANAQACAMLGYSPAGIREISMDRILDKRHPNTADLLKNLAYMGKWKGDTHLIRGDGSLFSVEISASGFKTRQGSELLTFMIRDNTWREQAEAHLRESEERYRGLFNSMSEGFALAEMIYDDSGRARDYRFLEVNPAFGRITGIAVEATAGRTAKELVPALEPQWIESFAQVVETGNPVRFEKYSHALQKWFEVMAFSPKPNQFAMVFDDVTEREHHREMMEHQRELLLGIIENIPIMIAIHEPRRKTFTFNRAFRDTLGCSETDFSRHTPPDPPETAQCVVMRDVLSAAESGWRDLAITTISGEMVESSWSGFRLSDETCIGIGIDIRDRKRTERLLKEAQMVLEEKVRERTEQLQSTVQALENEILERRKAQSMLERLSRKTLQTMENDRQTVAKELHDSVSASMAAIKFGLEAVSLDNGEVGVAADAVRQAIAYLAETIKESKRIAARLRPLMLEDLGLLSTIDWHVREFANSYPRIAVIKKISVAEEEIPEPLKIVVYRILQEALNNSARHSNARQIVLHLSRESEDLFLEVKDNGSGFNPDELGQRGDPLSGHGLRSMQERAEICGGTFDLKTGPQQGVRIRVRLPLSVAGMVYAVQTLTEDTEHQHQRRVSDRT